MRTTVTIDEDVEQLLKDRMRQTHTSFKETLNQALRKGLSAVKEIQAEAIQPLLNPIRLTWRIPASFSLPQDLLAETW